MRGLLLSVAVVVFFGTAPLKAHPGDEYSTLVEGTVMTWREGAEWRTVNAGESFSVPANIVHETKNVGTGAAKAVNAFVLQKGKPRVTPAP
jgi:quercetin dioxygenase-like cupin family protein